MGSKRFDPYHTWLGIPPKYQPPHHYRLLGLELFENDPDVISHAADQRMAHVRTFQNGNNAALSQQILTEISAARVCLLNDEKRTAYDAALRKTMASQTSPPPPPPAPVRPARGQSQNHPAPRSRRKAAPSPRPLGTKRLLAWIGLAVVLVVVGTLVNKGCSIPPVRPATKAAAKGGQDPSLPSSQPQDPTAKGQRAAMPADGATPATAANGPQPPSAASICPGTPPTLARNAVPAGAGEPSRLATSLAADGPVLFPPSLAPVPGTNAQTKERRLLQELFRADYDAAKTAEQKAILAEMLIAKAKENQVALGTKYVLLKLAHDIAVQAAAWAIAFEAIDEMAKAFEINSVELKTEVLARLLPKVQEEAEQRMMGCQANQLVDAAIDCDHVDLAIRLVDLAASAATTTHDEALANQVRTRAAGVQELARRYEKAKPAIDRLKKAPNDARANLVAGRYYCLDKGDWDRGLPLLAAGSDAALKAAAARDLQQPKLPGPQEEVGDAWWELAETASGTPRAALRARAACWYERALPRSTGLIADKLEKRLRIAEESRTAEASPPAPRR